MAPLKVEELLSNVLKGLLPREHERKRIQAIVDGLTERINKLCREMGVKARAELQGSIAKDTWISGDRDIDIFIIFSKGTPPEEARRLGLEIARLSAGSNYMECYAEHPYVKAFINGYVVDLVPCIEMNSKGGSKPLTAVDRTPLHTMFVREKANEKLKNEVRLLKGFMKGIGVYGAEIKVGGFSGYLCELITIYYGSFLNVLNNARKWRPFATVIDVANHYESPSQALSFFKSPLVVVDPVDSNRNAAAALSLEKLSQFILASHLFLLKPNERYFKQAPEVLQEASRSDAKKYLERSKTTLIALMTRLEPSPPDVLWGQINRSCNGIAKLLEREGFKVLRWSAWSDDVEEVVFLFELESRRLTPTVKRMGPPVTAIDDVMKFLGKHVSSPNTVAGPYVEGDRLVVLTIKRAEDAVSFIKDGIGKADLSRSFLEAFRIRLEVAVDEDVVDLPVKHIKEYRQFIMSYLRGSPHWLPRP
ncbi:MAG: CCA tRNA nucleotidyltransferase [Candidatus Nezhaarchaeota archaeon]|nr:CCA tRNA nucleotidyltransferase [Candidatus Nezhaarchaeota archaeon]